MVHYPPIIRQPRAPRNYSCSRFDGEHQPSVRDAKATTSRKNVAHTSAIEEQIHHNKKSPRFV